MYLGYYSCFSASFLVSIDVSIIKAVRVSLNSTMIIEPMGPYISSFDFKVRNVANFDSIEVEIGIQTEFEFSFFVPKTFRQKV